MFAKILFISLEVLLWALSTFCKATLELIKKRYHIKVDLFYVQGGYFTENTLSCFFSSVLTVIVYASLIESAMAKVPHIIKCIINPFHLNWQTEMKERYFSAHILTAWLKFLHWPSYDTNHSYNKLCNTDTWYMCWYQPQMTVPSISQDKTFS